MKKVTALFCILLFLIINSGLAVSFHWCGRKLSSVEFFSSGSHTCRCGKKVMKPKCCKDKSIVLKEKTDSAKINQFNFKLEIPKDICFFIEEVNLSPSQPLSFSGSTIYQPPPDNPKIPIFLLDRVILI